MTIRRKLLLLLLGITIPPLLVVAVVHEVSIRLTLQRLTHRIRGTMDADARLHLQQLLASVDETLRQQSRLVDALIRCQAREAELRLAQDRSNSLLRIRSASHVSDGSALETDTIQGESAIVELEGGRQTRLHYDRLACFLPNGIDANDVAKDVERLRDMTFVYQEIHRLGPRGMLWQYTSLENGLHMTYPATDTQVHPDNYDPRTRQWYLQAKENRDVVRVGPLVDAVTGKMIITIAAPLWYPDGSFAGVTAIDRAIPDVLATMKMPEHWEKGTEKMLVVIDPRSDPCNPRVLVALRSHYADGGDWQQKIQLEELQSGDVQALRQMAGDLQAGRAGTRQMDYEGRSCLWVYGRPLLSKTVPLLIVPYDTVTELAAATSHAMLDNSAFWLEITGITLLLAVAVTTGLAVMRARSLTQPISDLAIAGARLAEGDYAAHVQIKTGDELEELGRIFNQTGPRLKEREEMRRSLELARAIQQNLLPSCAPGLNHFELAGQCLYCDETGGDYYDFVDPADLGPGKVGIVVGDVCGHGISAALLMTEARSSLRANTRRYGTDLVRVLAEINRDLVRDTAADKFLTLFYGIVDDQNLSLTWASGGHDPALWYHAKEGTIEELPNTGMLMGIFEDASFELAGPIYPGHGDIIVVGTDGIWEARDDNGNLFGKDRLRDILRCASGSAEDICHAILQSVDFFSRAAGRQDDITLVVLKAV